MSIHAEHSFGCHRRRLCALAAACSHFGSLLCRTRRPPCPSPCSSPALLALRCGGSGCVSDVVQSQRLRLLALSAYHVFLLRKLIECGRAFISPRSNGAILQFAIRRVCGVRFVFPCMDLALRARLLCEISALSDMQCCEAAAEVDACLADLTL